MPFVTSQFSVSVTLKKLVHRAGSEAGSNKQTIDLTPLLGLAGSVRVWKSIREPAGAFSISFADQISSTFQDTLYALVEPMDLIEIRASRSSQAGQALPLIMRGFVSQVGRSESFSSDGKPSRAVTVSGQDAGKILQQTQILWQYAIASGEPWLTQFASLEANGIQVQPMKVSAFMTEVIEKIVNARVQEINVFASAQLSPFTINATVPDGSVIPAALGDVSGSIWSLMMRCSDAPIWNELFTLDTESGPVVIFRPRPSRPVAQNRAGGFIMPGATDPGTIAIDASEIVSLSTSRTDAGVANFWWVDPGVNMLNTNMGVSVGNLVGQPAATSPANAKALYGVRMMDGVGTVLSSDDDQVPYQSDPAPLTGPAAFVKQRIAELAALIQDNVLFEDGTMTAKGSERFVPGQFLHMTRGSTSAVSYLTGVDHSIQPLATWTTSLTFERGDGFYQRDQAQQGQGWAEGRSGPYSPAGAA